MSTSLFWVLCLSSRAAPHSCVQTFSCEYKAYFVEQKKLESFLTQEGKTPLLDQQVQARLLVVSFGNRGRTQDQLLPRSLTIRSYLYVSIRERVRQFDIQLNTAKKSRGGSPPRSSLVSSRCTVFLLNSLSSQVFQPCPQALDDWNWCKTLTRRRPYVSPFLALSLSP